MTMFTMCSTVASAVVGLRHWSQVRRVYARGIDTGMIQTKVIRDWPYKHLIGKTMSQDGMLTIALVVTAASPIPATIRRFLHFCQKLLPQLCIAERPLRHG